MKRKIIAVLLVPALLCGCSQSEPGENLSLSEQTLDHLDIENENSYTPLNYQPQKALWFTMEDFRKALENKTEEEFVRDIAEEFEKIKDTGFNTVYVHVRAYNDAYYNSDIFPPAAGNNGDFDPLERVIEAAHCQNLSVHAWINPLRCQTEEQLKSLDSGYVIRKWYDDVSKRNDYICKVKDRWYLNPAHREVIDYIGDGVTEIVNNYQVDGVHIDDYFYPEKSEDFDKKAFSQSGQSDLSDWRRGNTDTMVKEIYDRVKSRDARLLFGISPQGNMTVDREDLYADVKKWASEDGFCDYIVPQLYYGFKNESMPFEETFYDWKEQTTAVPLVAGICTYKVGKTDKWAGTGKNEWVEDKEIPSRQIGLVLENGAGIAVYSYDTLFSEQNKSELEKITCELGDRQLS